MRVVACIPVRGRLPLVHLTIKRLLEKNGCYRVICVADTNDEEYAIVKAGGTFIYHENKPLGAKWNTAFIASRMYNPDACLFVGSSDWLSNNWLEYLTPYLNEYDMVGKVDFNMVHVRGYDTIHGDLQIGNWGGYDIKSKRNGEAIGIGRLIRKEMLEKLDYQPFDPKLDNSMDYSMHQRVLSLNGKIKAITSDEVQSLSLSCDEWCNKHNFAREMNYTTSDYIYNTDAWIAKWGFEEVYEFHKNKR